MPAPQRPAAPIRVSSLSALAISLAALMAASAGCGSSSPPGGGTGGSSGGSGGSSGEFTGACGAVNGSCSFDSLCIESVAGAYPFAESMSECLSEAAGSTWSSALCSHGGAIGGCRIADGASCAAMWSYAGTVSDLMASCTGQGGTWLTP